MKLEKKKFEKKNSQLINETTFDTTTILNHTLS